MKFSIPVSLVVAFGSMVLGSTLFAVFLFSTSLHPIIPAAVAEASSYVSIDPSQLTAKSAIVYDPQNGRIWYEKDSQTPRPLASLTKLMTVETVLSTQPVNKSITVTAEDLKPDGDWGFKVGDEVKLYDLLRFALIASSNDAMAAAATSLGDDYLNQINKTSATLGLSHTYFLNSTGLDLDTDTSGAYGSANDVALFASSFLKKYPQYFELTSQPKVTLVDGNRTLSANATSVPLLDIPGFIGAKTGYTDLAGGNLVAAFDVDIGHPIIIVVLGSTEAGRFTDIRTLINAARAAAEHS